MCGLIQISLEPVNIGSHSMVADPRMMSCEPNRCSQYSSDLRWQILWQRIGMEQNFCSIETNLFQQHAGYA